MKKRDLAELLVELAEFDEKTATPGDLLNYALGLDELAAVARDMSGGVIVDIDYPNAGIVGDSMSKRIELTEAVVRAIQPELRTLVRQFAAGTPAVQLFKIAVSGAAVGGASPHLVATGSLRDVVLLSA